MEIGILFLQDPVTIVVGASLASALAGGYIVYRFQIGRDKIAERCRASRQFRSAFSSTLARLERNQPVGEDTVTEMPSQHEAKIRFEPSLLKRKHSAFSAAWLDYYEAVQHYDKYDNAEITKRLQCLLAYASR